MPQKSTHRCPFCFAALPSDRVLRSCPIGRTEKGTPCQRALPSWRTDSRAADTVERCPDHDVALVDRCHSPGCQKPLPAGWSEITTTCIAMAGTRSSGKTVYIKVAAEQLQGWGRANGLIVGHYNDESKRNFEARFGRLEPNAVLYGATEPEIPGSTNTAAHQQPILLRIQRPTGGRNHVLVLRDVAGENLQDATMDRSHFRFLANGDGIILMVDPSDSHEVRRALDGLVDLPRTTFDPAAVWGNLEQLQTAIVGDQASLVPIAVAISKFDLVLQAAEQRGSKLAAALSARGSRMRHDPSLRSAGLQSVDSELLDLEIRSLCDYISHPQLVTQANAYGLRAPVQFFALSSLGHAPAVNRIGGRGMIPYRCLDPIKWFLAEGGVL